MKRLCNCNHTISYLPNFFCLFKQAGTHSTSEPIQFRIKKNKRDLEIDQVECTLLQTLSLHEKLLEIKYLGAFKKN